MIGLVSGPGDLFQAATIAAGEDPIAGLTFTEKERKDFAALHLGSAGLYISPSYIKALSGTGPTRFISGVMPIHRGVPVFKAPGTVDLGPTLERIAQRDIKFRQDGTPFNNIGNPLPRQAPGYYQEWVVPTETIEGAGPQRIVVGEGGEMYYSPDHYRSSIPIGG